MTLKKKLWISILSILVILAAFTGGFYAGFHCYGPIRKWKREKRRSARKERLVGKMVPPVVTSTLSGEEWRLRDQTGKVILIDFWATWCGPCGMSVPNLKKIYSKYRGNEDFLLAGVSLDKDPEKVTEYCKKKEIKWLQLIEPDKGWENSFARAFEVHGIPDICLVDKQGIVTAIDLWVASDKGLKKLEKEIDRLLGEEEKGPAQAE